MCSNHVLQYSRVNGSQWQVSFPGPLALLRAGDRWQGSGLKMFLSTLLLPCSYFFQPSSVLSSQTLVSHSDLFLGPVSVAPLSYE